MSRIHPEIRLRARAHRKSPTTAEHLLWRFLRAGQVDAFKFRRQHPIGSFIVDFCCIQAMLVFEIDGEYHFDQLEYDQYRTAWLEGLEYQVIRFTNQEVITQIEMVIEEILHACQGRMTWLKGTPENS